ncbi:MAG: hypothetical protein C4320_09265 [Armatimonadota bacterium]
MRFTDLRPGARVRVTAVRDGEASVRLQELGLIVGTEVEVIRIAPLGDPIEICLRGYRLCIRGQEANAFDLEPIGS